MCGESQGSFLSGFTEKLFGGAKTVAEEGNKSAVDVAKASDPLPTKVAGPQKIKSLLTAAETVVVKTNDGRKTLLG